MVNNLLFLVILAAFLPAPIVYLLGRNVGKKVSWLVLGIFLLSTVVFGSLIPVVEHEILLEEYSWVAEPVKLTLGFMADGLSIPMVFTYIFVFTGATLFSIPYMEKRFSLDDVEDTNENYARFYTFFLLYGGSVAGCMPSSILTGVTFGSWYLRRKFCHSNVGSSASTKLAANSSVASLSTSRRASRAVSSSNDTKGGLP